ncbi:MAG TPA: phosphatidylglycerophosphatase A [Patescibacteria group bacterium]
MTDKWKKIFLSAGGIGNLPLSGTWASLATAVILFLIRQKINSPIVGIASMLTAAILICLISIKFIKDLLKKDFDKSWIVADEVAGVLVAGTTLWVKSSASYLITAFLVFLGFRIFDGLKPGIIGRIDRTDKPQAVLLDDILAGLLTAAVILPLLFFFFRA